MNRNNKPAKGLNKASKKKRFNKLVPAAGIFKDLLPKDYRNKWALIQQYQQFFLSQESDAVFQLVKVANVTEQYLHVSVPSPALSSYLRLHSQQIKALMMESFGQALELKISARPDAAGENRIKSKLQPAQHFTQKVCSQIHDAAESIEDDDLQAALKSLSKTIRE